MFEQARTWDAIGQGAGLAVWLRSAAADLGARFGSWKSQGEEDEDILGCADPQLVAALEFLASLIPDEEEKTT